MTNREAIDLYESVRYNLTNHRHKEAVDVAFAALTQNHFREVTKMTNADHIRSMTDEELAALLDAFCESSECRTADGAVCPFYSDCPHDENIGCNGTRGIWTDWLKQPFSGGEP